MKNVLFALAAGAALLTGCDRAVSNVQTIISDNCGKTWRQIAPGQAVPARVGVCALKVQVPSAPMTGEANYRVAFKNNVLIGAGIAYEYEIFDPLQFITEARYLGRQNSAGDSAENAAGGYETAENTVIDRRLRAITSEVVQAAEIVDFDQSAMDDLLMERGNEALKERGVRLISLSFVMTPDEQTRQAIDVASALRVYESVGARELGERVTVAKAGAARIVAGGAAPEELPR